MRNTRYRRSDTGQTNRSSAACYSKYRRDLPKWRSPSTAPPGVRIAGRPSNFSTVTSSHIRRSISRLLREPPMRSSSGRVSAPSRSLWSMENGSSPTVPAKGSSTKRWRNGSGLSNRLSNSLCKDGPFRVNFSYLWPSATSTSVPYTPWPECVRIVATRTYPSFRALTAHVQFR